MLASARLDQERRTADVTGGAAHSGVVVYQHGGV
jgi:hypothetical protein